MQAKACSTLPSVLFLRVSFYLILEREEGYWCVLFFQISEFDLAVVLLLRAAIIMECSNEFILNMKDSCCVELTFNQLLFDPRIFSSASALSVCSKYCGSRKNVLTPEGTNLKLLF